MELLHETLEMSLWPFIINIDVQASSWKILASLCNLFFKGEQQQKKMEAKPESRRVVTFNKWKFS